MDNMYFVYFKLFRSFKLVFMFFECYIVFKNVFNGFFVNINVFCDFYKGFRYGLFLNGF